MFGWAAADTVTTLQTDLLRRDGAWQLVITAESLK